MTQNIYDTAEFFEGYSQMARSVHGLDGAPEWPALQALLPALAGFTITHVQDWAPTAEQLAAQPALDEERDRPMMVLVAATR